MPRKGQFKRGAKRASVLKRRYNSRPSQIKRRSKRTTQRRRAIKEGRVQRGDGRELDHLDRRSLSYGSTRVVSRKTNRAKSGRMRRKRRYRRGR